jgi:hypothetical protein
VISEQQKDLIPSSSPRCINIRPHVALIQEGVGIFNEKVKRIEGERIYVDRNLISRKCLEGRVKNVESNS